jgi:hypothetical protein
MARPDYEVCVKWPPAWELVENEFCMEVVKIELERVKLRNLHC